MRQSIFALLILFAGNSFASSVVIDFEDAPDGVQVGLTFDGYFFSGMYASGLPGPVSSTIGLLPNPDGNTMYRLDGGLFSLHSLDLYTDAGDYDMRIVGTLEGGSQLEVTFTALALVNDTFLFSDDWQNLTSISFDPYGPIQIDNIAVTAVPVPAAIWLFASALALAGWRRRQ